MENRSLKIYKPQDIEGLLNIDNLKLKTKQECEELLQKTKEKCALLEKETYDGALSKLHKEQLELFEQSHKKINDFFNGVQNEISLILKVLLESIEINENSSKIMSNLLFSEVEKLKIKSNKFTIYGNSKVLAELKENIKNEYTLTDNIFFDYEIKSELGFGECLVESDYVMSRIDVTDFYNKVLNILGVYS